MREYPVLGCIGRQAYLLFETNHPEDCITFYILNIGALSSCFRQSPNVESKQEIFD